AHPRRAHRAGNEDGTGGVDLFRLAIDELPRRGLNGTRLLVGESAADREAIRIFANDVLHAAIAPLFEELQGTDADTAHQSKDVAVRRRLEVRLGRRDTFVPEPFHRGRGAVAQGLRFRRVADAVDGHELLDARLRELFQGPEPEPVHRAGEVLANAVHLTERRESLLLHLLEFALTDDVELPARELRGEPHVLAFAPDGERELLVGDDQL